MTDIQNSNIPKSFSLTLGKNSKQRVWKDVQQASWDEICKAFTNHIEGTKDGECFIPGIFSSTKRTKNEAVEIGLLVLDCDTGETSEQIEAALKSKGWAGVIYSTHSHLTETMEVSKAGYEKKGNNSPEQYLIEEKGMKPEIAKGAKTEKSRDPKKVLIRHQPCPKFRVVIPLSMPWRASEFASQKDANLVWKNFVIKIANILGLHHDQSCVDSSRLYYGPRHPKGAEHYSEIIEGEAIDPRKYVAAPDSSQNTKALDGLANKSKQKEFIYEDPDTGECLDLVKWAAKHSQNFDIVNVLKNRKPEIFNGYVIDGYKHHIRCVNMDMHTSQMQDNATFIVSPDHSDTGSFVHHCMHAHCCDEDRLFFIKRMLDEGWLCIEDLNIEASISLEEIINRANQLNADSPTSEVTTIVKDLTEANIDPIERDAIFKIINKTTGTNLGTLRESAKTILKGGSKDKALYIAERMLDGFYQGGKHLHRATDKCFWRYNGKHWERIGDEQVKHQLFQEVKKWANPKIPGEDYHQMLRASYNLLIAEQAKNRNFFKNLSEMPSVINCQNGEVWLDDHGKPTLMPLYPVSTSWTDSASLLR